MGKKKRVKDGLESDVLKFRPLKDKKGRYVPYCDLGWHMGYVKKPEVCVARQCEHYYKLRITPGESEAQRVHLSFLSYGRE